MNDRPQYEKRFGSYYLIRKVPSNPVTNPDGERIILMTERLAIAFDISMPNPDNDELARAREAILMKHGSPEEVTKWAVDARARYAGLGTDIGRQMANGLRVVTFPPDFPCEEINRCLNNSGYLGEMLMKWVPMALEKST